jgi:hypothetical protein
MSLTSYRAAPSRVTNIAAERRGKNGVKTKKGPEVRIRCVPPSGLEHCEWVLTEIFFRERLLQSLATSYSSNA